MLPKKYRLPVQSLIASKGAAVRSRYFLLKAFSAVHPYNRYAVVVGKKVFAQATKRNSLRRLLYSTIATLPSVRHGDYLISPTAEVTKLGSKDDIIRELKSIFKTYL